MNRKVAVINRNNLKEKYQDSYLIMSTETENLSDDFKKIEFIEKVKAEIDENYKQLIPYVVLQNELGEIALYQRQGTEKRLHGLWSAGFGGHIEDFEYIHGEPIESLVTKSAVRELSEEFSDTLLYQLTFKGIINEEETKVGRTHIAWVFTAKVEKEKFESSNEISEIKWVNANEVFEYKTELWSEMAIKLILNTK